jgi:hypothetical protein
MTTPAEIKKQVEYYLSDANLKRDKFFNGKIKENDEGWLSIALLLNCNKVKQMKVKSESIADSLKDSELVEVSEDKLQIRRKDKTCPEYEGAASKKREEKAAAKEGSDAEEENKEENKEDVDPKTAGWLTEEDFNSPHVVRFETTKDLPEGTKKVDWKTLVEGVKEKCTKIKVAYVRSDEKTGEIAISKHKLAKATLDELLALKITANEAEFTFRMLDGEDLEKFWQDHGGHYQFCIRPKLRQAKKLASKNKSAGKRGEGGSKAPKGKTQFEIAGVLYADINKVKSKSRAILNLKKDGEVLTGNDEDFMKQIIKQHDKHALKMKDFKHFEVGVHPEHERTRCFFVHKKNGTLEDFSVSKCIKNLEDASA